VLPRLGLFDELMAADGVRPETQDRFHRHVWRDRPEISVMMSRGEARTVSVTTVEVVGAGHATPGRVAMEYRALHGRETVGGGVVIRSRVGVGVPVVAG
jgi:hypothetical protein